MCQPNLAGLSGRKVDFFFLSMTLLKLPAIISAEKNLKSIALRL